MKSNNPFEKLGALEQKLYQETSTKDSSQTTEISRNPENLNTGIPVNQKSSKPVSKNTGKPENHKTRDQDFQKSSNSDNSVETRQKREFFEKATYRLCDEALEAVEDAKKTLKRQYRLKVNLEEIVETAILETYKDLQEKKENSTLVVKYSGKPENQNS